MTKWTLPEGRKPLTDADIAALTRRLAGTAVDYKELYQAAKRDAEEAEAYAAELEAKLDTMVAALAYEGRRTDAAEAKLAKAVTSLQHIAANKITDELTVIEWDTHDTFTVLDTCISKARTTLAELKGYSDD